MATIPSISLIPSGYKAGKVYSVLPTDGSGDLTFARASTASRINKNNLIENVGNNVPRLDYTDGGCPSLLLEPSSTNLITQSESFGNSYWTKSGASIEGDASTAGVEKVVNGDFSSDSDWSKGGWTISGGKANSNSAGNMTQVNALEVSKTYILEYTISNYVSGVLKILAGGISGTGTGIATNSNGTYTQQLEADGTTLYLKSESFVGSIDNVSVKEVSGFSAPSVDSPLGAFKLVFNGSGDELYANIASTSGVSSSVYIKGTLGETIKFGVQGGESIFILSGEWQRIENYLQTSSSRFTINTYGGATAREVYIFGTQLEQNSSATSYIKTAGTAISRTADSASKSGISSLLGQTEGTLFAEFSADALASGSNWVNISDNTSSNWIFIGKDDGKVRAYIKTNGVAHFDNLATNLTSSDKVALTYKSGDYALYINGVLIASGTTAFSFSSALDTLAFGNYNGGLIVVKTSYSKVQVYNTRLSNSELQTLTTL